MDLPSSGTPWLMVFVRCNVADSGPHIGFAVVFIVPQEITGDANLLRFVTGRFVRQVGPAKKSGQLLDADVVAIDRALRPRSNLAKNWRWVIRLRRMVLRFFKQLEVPVVEIDAGAIGSFWRATVCRHQIASEIDNLFFERVEFLFFGRSQILPP